MSPHKLYAKQAVARYGYAPRPGPSRARLRCATGSPLIKSPRKPEQKLTALVTSSKTLLTHPERIGIFSLGLHAACGQCPCLVKSKSNSAAWRMSLNQPLGYRVSLRRGLRTDFDYKWGFLAPSSGIAASQRRKLGLRNVFIFALDHHDYTLFEPWPGLDLEFYRGVAPATPPGHGRASFRL